LASDRETTKTAFLEAHGLAGARRVPLDQDASSRNYERLYMDRACETLIFMDQPPALESRPCPPEATPEERKALGFNATYRLAAGSVDAFVACAGWLKAQGLSAPDVLAADPAQGLAVLEDLGHGLFARAIEAGASEDQLYSAAVDALLHLHSLAPPAVLEAHGSSWPLLTYDDLALQFAGDLFPEWLPRLKPGLSFDARARADWDAAWAAIRRFGEAGASVFCHRDYHAENLIWLPEREGAARVGMIDFQDALLAHPVWDLSMLLHDARRQVSPELEAAMLGRYLAARPELDRAAFIDAYKALGALNIVRILGVFARLVTRDGKPKYQAFMPRMWGYLETCLDAPSLGPVRAWLDAHVPHEARS
jgi:aminoglycoside/choline kinase family phosphotransferase